MQHSGATSNRNLYGSMKEHAYQFRVAQIVNLVRGFDPASCKEHAVRYIRSAKVEEGGYIWLGVMLFEWATILDSKSLRKMTYKDFRRIMNRMIELQNHTKGPIDCQTATAWLRRISYQQFPYQRRSSRIDLARQLMLFGEKGEAARLGLHLPDVGGIQIRDFLVLFVVLIMHLYTEKEFSFSLSWFRPLRASMRSGAIERFIENLTFTGSFEKPTHESGYYENSPLFRKPFIRVTTPNGMTCYKYLHETHVVEALSDYIYDTLKAIDANKFMGEFGNYFSKYLESYLSEAVENLATESDLKQKYHLEGSKIVDFMVREEDETILIEAKAIEANSTIRSTASGNILGQRLRDTILKAITQARKTAEGIVLNEQEIHKEFFLIVVTYKQLYLATGEILRECIDPQIIEKFEDESKGSQLLAFENIFVLSVDEFERLITAVGQKKTTIRAS